MTGAVLYIECIFLMASVGKDVTVFIFISLLHGLVVNPLHSYEGTVNRGIIQY